MVDFVEDDVIGLGLELWFTNSAGVLTKVAGLIKCNRPNLSVDEEETTDHDSVGGVREYLATLADPGELKGTVKYRPGSPTDTLFNEHLASRKKRPFKIVTPTASGPAQTHPGICFLKTYEPDDGEVAAVRTAEFSARVSGAMTQAAVV